MNPKEVLALCREHGVVAVDIRFTDLLGSWQHFTIPVARLDEDTFDEGLGFDGSSIRGWKSIHESDMLVVPQSETAYVDPLIAQPTLAIIGNIVDPISGNSYTRDPRHIARQAVRYLRSTGVADEAYFGLEAEFFVFDDVRFDQKPNEAFYFLDSSEAEWNRGSQLHPNVEHTIPHKGGYFPVPPADQHMNLRNEMMTRMIECGLEVECQHHEVATAGQGEIDLKFQPLLKMADWMMTYKYIVKNVARHRGKIATFMPKPLYNDNGSGMHTHVSLWKDGQPLLAGNEYAGLSQIGLHAVGGILHHAPALLAFTNPTTNSYKRLVPGYEAPVHLAYSQRNRSAACRIPMISANPKSKRVEFRCPDASCNPYLAFAAILLAVIDGIQNKLHPGDPLDANIYELPPDQEVAKTPSSLGHALVALQKDHDFLLKGDVFTTDVLRDWTDYKRANEVEALRIHPHPQEFCMYFDV